MLCLGHMCVPATGGQRLAQNIFQPFLHLALLVSVSKIQRLPNVTVLIGHLTWNIVSTFSGKNCGQAAVYIQTSLRY